MQSKNRLKPTLAIKGRTVVTLASGILTKGEASGAGNVLFLDLDAGCLGIITSDLCVFLVYVTNYSITSSFKEIMPWEPLPPPPQKKSNLLKLDSYLQGEK